MDLYKDAIVFIPLCVLFGLFVGSFLNVVIHRLPLMLEADWRAQAQELLNKGDAYTGGSCDSSALAGIVPPRQLTPAQKRYGVLPMPSLEWNEQVGRETAHMYERVKAVIPPVEWPFFAPYVKAINALKLGAELEPLAGRVEPVALDGDDAARGVAALLFALPAFAGPQDQAMAIQIQSGFQARPLSVHLAGVAANRLRQHCRRLIVVGISGSKSGATGPGTMKAAQSAGSLWSSFSPRF